MKESYTILEVRLIGGTGMSLAPTESHSVPFHRMKRSVSVSNAISPIDEPVPRVAEVTTGNCPAPAPAGPCWPSAPGGPAGTLSEDSQEVPL